MKAGRIVLDTNVMVDYIGDDVATLDIIESAEAAYIPSIVMGELFFGAFHSGRIADNLTKLFLLLRDFEIVDIDINIAEEYGLIKSELRKMGNPIPENDIWIASIARKHGLALVSRDKHFKVINNLNLIEI